MNITIFGLAFSVSVMLEILNTKYYMENLEIY
jgi:hypothetical protein